MTRRRVPRSTSADRSGSGSDPSASNRTARTAGARRRGGVQRRLRESDGVGELCLLLNGRPQVVNVLRPRERDATGSCSAGARRRSRSRIRSPRG